MSKKYIVIGLAVLLVLAGAAFMAGRLLLPQAAKTEMMPEMLMGPDGEPIVAGSGPRIRGQGGDGVQSIAVIVERAPELPEREQDVMGQIQKIEDNSVFVTPISGPGITVSMDGDGNVDVAGDSPEGAVPAVEIVITQDTEIYRDVMVMMEAGPNGMADMPETIQQEVEPIKLDDIGDNGIITAWGQKRGERVVADVVLYMGF